MAANPPVGSVLPIAAAIARLQSNEALNDQWVNGDDSYQPRDPSLPPVPTIPAFMAQQAVALAADISTVQTLAAQAGLYQTYNTYAQANADLANIPANKWVEVENDETVTGSPTTRYQNVSGALTHQTVVAKAVNILFSGRHVSDKLSDFLSIQDRANGALIGTGTVDCRAAFLAAKALTNRIWFPRVGDAPTTYYFASLSAGDLDNVSVGADFGVTVSFPVNAPYSYYKLVTALNDIPIVFRDINVNHGLVYETPLNRKNPAAIQKQNRRSAKAVDFTGSDFTSRTNAWPTADTFLTTSAASVTARNITYNLPQGTFTGGFTALGIGQSISARLSSATSQSVLVGAFIRTLTGFSFIYAPLNTTNQQMFQGYKLAGQNNVQTQDCNYPGVGGYTSFTPGKSVWSILRVARDKAVIMFNGKAVSSPFAFVLGDIIDVGFMAYSNGSTDTFTISEAVINSNDQIYGLPPLTEICVYGDSTSEDFPGGWVRAMQQRIDLFQGNRTTLVTNQAIVGQNTAQQLAVMQSNGFGNAYYVFIGIGTNDIQAQTQIEDSGSGGTYVAGFRTNFTTMLTMVKSAGRVPIVIMPWMYYTQSQSGGRGQPSGAYDMGAPYRAVIARACAENNVRLIDTTLCLPNPDPSYILTPRELLRDNIHQDQVGYAMYADEAALALLSDYYYTPAVLECLFAAENLASGVSAITPFGYYQAENLEVGLIGLLQPTTTTNGTSLAYLPRHLWPSRTVVLQALATTSGNVPPQSVTLNISTTGVVQIYGWPSGMTIINMEGVRYFAEVRS